MALFTLSEDTKAILINRLKSLLWRTGSMVGVLVLAFITENITLLNVSPAVAVFVGLVTGEITKYLNTKTY